MHGLTLTSSNYDVAVEMIQERYGKPQIIISVYMGEILKIQPCVEGGRLGPLRYVYDKISVHVRGLAAMGVSSKEYGSLLIPIIMSKLSSDVRLQISRKSTNEVWEIDELLDTIKSEIIDAREASEGAKSSGVENRKPPINPIHDNRNIPPNAHALVAKGPEEFKIRCAYCESLHYSASCDKVFNCESRKKVLANSNRYFNCLRKGHNDSQCMSEKNCRHCKKRHHQSM